MEVKQEQLQELLATQAVKVNPITMQFQKKIAYNIFRSQFRNSFCNKNTSYLSHFLFFIV